MRCILVHIIPYYLSYQYHTIIHTTIIYHMTIINGTIIICRWVPDVNFLYYSVNYLVVAEVKVRKRTSFAAFYT
eukprot:COSAG06_NODE_13_length_35352_cov_49.626255_10_plen_74_part_00